MDEVTFCCSTHPTLMPNRVQCQWTVQQGEEVHLPGAGEVTVYFPDAGEVYGYAAAESKTKMFLWTWDIWIRRGDVDTSWLEAIIQLKMLWAGSHLGVSFWRVHQNIKQRLDATSHPRKSHQCVNFMYSYLIKLQLVAISHLSKSQRRENFMISNLVTQGSNQGQATPQHISRNDPWQPAQAQSRTPPDLRQHSHAGSRTPVDLPRTARVLSSGGQDLDSLDLRAPPQVVDLPSGGQEPYV